MFKKLLVILVLSVFLAVPSKVFAAINTTPNLKVAFIGDVGLTSNSKAVLKQIKSQNVDALVISGDFSYDESDNGARKFEDMLNNILGENFPIFLAVGNHDTKNWPVYQDYFKKRVNRLPQMVCSGDLGINSSCVYKGLKIILSGIGTLGSDHNSYIQQELNNSTDFTWKICSWHKNQATLQVGSKPDEVGWQAYEDCRQNGAIIITSHEHSYERTKTLTNMQFRTVSENYSDPNNLLVAPGNSFVVVTGLGGLTKRKQVRCKPTMYPYGCEGEWAFIYTVDQQADYGALIITYNVNGDPAKAKGEFVTLHGKVVDSFTITSKNTLQELPTPTPTTTFDKYDINKDGGVDILDVIKMITLLFQ